MEITPRDFDIMIFWAFRYALGRMTYSVDDLRELLIKYKADILPRTKKKIIEEIDKTIKTNRAGMQMDIDCWLQVKEEFENDTKI